MGSFALSDINKVRGHAAKGMTWSHGAIVVKKLPPKGAVPPRLQAYTGPFAAAARECAQKTRGLTGADRVQAMNACIAAARKRR